MGSLGFIWKSLFRRKVRAILTMASLVTAFLLLVLLRSVGVVFEAGEDFANVHRLSVSSKFSVIDTLPKSHVRKVEQVEGVKTVTHMNWFGGAYQDPYNMVMTFAVDPSSYFDVYPENEISAEHHEAFNASKTGMVAPRRIAERYGWQVGDRIPLLSTIFQYQDSSMGWQFDLVGLFDPENEFGDVVLIRHDYFDEGWIYGGDEAIGWIGVVLEDPDRAREIAKEIDSLFENTSDPTRTATEAELARQWLAQIGNISLMVNGVLGAVFFTMLLLAGNTMMQGLRERTPEFGVVKTLGFTNARLFAYVLGESLLLVTMSAVVGVALGTLVVGFLLIELLGDMPPMLQSWSTVLLAGVVAVGFSVLVGLFPSITAARLQIVDALSAR